MKGVLTAVTVLLSGVPALAQTTNCFWIGTTYTCTTYGGGGTISTTRCYTIGNSVRCTQY